MTLQELQELAERQRQQILKNNQELIAKQQKLMEMQSGVRKASIGSPGRAAGNQDAYASKLRETYQNHLERLREMKLVQDEVESQKFSNIELGEFSNFYSIQSLSHFPLTVWWSFLFVIVYNCERSLFI